MTPAFSSTSLLRFETERFERSFDVSPFGFEHELHRLDLFSFPALQRLAERMAGTAADWFVAGSAARADTRFHSVEAGYMPPQEAMARLEAGRHRILLKRAENHDSAYRDLLDALFAEVIGRRGGLHGARVVRRETGIFISSGAATTPFHYDPEINFFMQIEGEKEYHVYAPAAVSEPELENFFVHGHLDIAQLSLAGRDETQEHVFRLAPGRGHHQPQNAPHWVRTGSGRSISFAFVWETDQSRACGRTRACNWYLRRLGLSPAGPGASPARDSVKAGAMRVVTPLRQAAVGIKRALVRG